jgi:Protein of unknown function (DUF1501)
MLSISDTRRLGRRSFLKVGALGLGGLSLPWLFQSRAQAQELSGVVKDRSVILLFLHGGPSQTETFDPKMTAPEGIRSATGELKTSLPGVTFGITFPKLARLADRLAIVRSYRAGDANHDIKPVVHRTTTLNANMGSVYARVAGNNHPKTGMATNAALFPRAVDPKAQPAQKGFGNFLSTGSVGAAYAPFVPGGTGEFQKDMQLKLSMDQIQDRRSLLAGLDGLRREVDTTGTVQALDKFQEQAFQVILGKSADALDLSKEDPKTVARYDTSPLATPESINKKWNNHKFYVDNVRTLGKLLLMARRLCEAGCGFVTVTTNFVWDMHADNNNAPVTEAMPFVGGPLDHALSAFIEDVEARGLSDRIMLVCTGEMGRTPRVNKKGGRDHWGDLTPLILYGGGLKTGQVIGRSDRSAGRPATEPYSIGHLTSTVMHSLFDVGKVRLLRGVPDDVSRVITGGDPIEELF